MGNFSREMSDLRREALSGTHLPGAGGCTAVRSLSGAEVPLWTVAPELSSLCPEAVGEAYPRQHCGWGLGIVSGALPSILFH